MRRIETEAGVLVGKVDRVTRTVRWHLECELCGELVALDKDTFEGKRPIVCDCGCKSPLVQIDPPAYFDFSVVFETVPAQPGQAAA